MIPKYIVAWVGLMIIAIINGTIREFTYAHYVSELSAHQLSTISLMALTGVFTWWMNRVWPIGFMAQAWVIGAAWLLMTVVFEFGFGHFIAGHSWSRLLADYNLPAGRLWALFLAWIFLLPPLVRKFASPQTGM